MRSTRWQRSGPPGWQRSARDANTRPRRPRVAAPCPAVLGAAPCPILHQAAPQAAWRQLRRNSTVSAASRTIQPRRTTMAQIRPRRPPGATRRRCRRAGMAMALAVAWAVARRPHPPTGATSACSSSLAPCQGRRSTLGSSTRAASRTTASIGASSETLASWEPAAVVVAAVAVAIAAAAGAREAKRSQTPTRTTTRRTSSPSLTASRMGVRCWALALGSLAKRRRLRRRLRGCRGTPSAACGKRRSPSPRLARSAAVAPGICARQARRSARPRPCSAYAHRQKRSSMTTSPTRSSPRRRCSASRSKPTTCSPRSPPSCRPAFSRRPRPSSPRGSAKAVGQQRSSRRARLPVYGAVPVCTAERWLH
mmetsp:Transcript_22321/g.56974  ORF Transcript_22321/g.56974 Transcript_22321/m.56974 type:complete len:366 (-) Transcript_22321:383-1480(-)